MKLTFHSCQFLSCGQYDTSGRTAHTQRCRGSTDVTKNSCKYSKTGLQGEKSVVPMPSRFPFSWVPIVWRMKDEDILDEARQEGGSHSVNHDDQSALAAKAAQQAALERNHDQLLVEETVPVDPGSLACPRGLQVGIDAVMYYSFIRLCIMLMVPAACFDLSIVLWVRAQTRRTSRPQTAATEAGCRPRSPGNPAVARALSRSRPALEALSQRMPPAAPCSCVFGNPPAVNFLLFSPHRPTRLGGTTSARAPTGAHPGQTMPRSSLALAPCPLALAATH